MGGYALNVDSSKLVNLKKAVLHALQGPLLDTTHTHTVSLISLSGEFCRLPVIYLYQGIYNTIHAFPIPWSYHANTLLTGLH